MTARSTVRIADIVTIDVAKGFVDLTVAVVVETVAALGRGGARAAIDRSGSRDRSATSAAHGAAEHDGANEVLGSHLGRS
jgi:hypothetical protein